MQLSIVGLLFSFQTLGQAQEIFGHQDVIRNKLPNDILDSWVVEDYKYLTYQEMRTRLYKLQELYPNIMQIETSEEMFSIKHEAFCGDEVCKLDIVTLTDFQVQSDDKAQVYISGALHGDEVIGPNVAFYLIEYLLSGHAQQDPFISNLLKQREIIITPMTNAVGYYHYEREERVNTTSSDYINNPNKKQARSNRKYLSFDINRDFPYNTKSNACLNTIAGRVIHQIYTQNVIVSALTFHGGINVIGYPWGSFNRVAYKDGYRSKESPDFQAFESIGWIMKNETGGKIPKRDNIPFDIEGYVFGDISSTIYPVQGGLEDWGYGGGWDNKDPDSTLYKCTPQSYLLNEKQTPQSREEYKNVRSAIYIVETDNSKKPDERTLGKRQVQKGDGHVRIQQLSVQEIKGKYDGHINRNIRLALAIIDLTKPYIQVNEYKDIGNDKIEVTWQVNGCHTLNEARAIVDGIGQNLLAQDKQGVCNYRLGRNKVQSIFKLVINSTSDLVLEAVADQHFGKSINPQDVSPQNFQNNPQTHLAQSRVQEQYKAVSPRKAYTAQKKMQMTKEQCKQTQQQNLLQQANVVKGRKLLELQQDQGIQSRKLQENKNPRSVDDKESLSVVLTPVYDQTLSGVFSLVQTSKNQISLNGRLNNLPLGLEVEVKLMKYGDLSSLAVEYPDYNSMGVSILTLGKALSSSISKEAFKIQDALNFPEGIKNLNELAGRAVIVTWEKDLLAFGILVNETRIDENNPSQVPKDKQANAVALCENLVSTVQYRAIFQLKQEGDKVTFDGLLRTTDKMENEYELILSLNHRKTFDLDFKNAYPNNDLNRYDYLVHPCYVIEKEKIEGQDWLLGRDLNMYGHHEDFDIQILEQSKCYIGLQNPEFRISDERFCQTILDRNVLIGQGDRKYTVNTLINVFLIGFLAGLILALMFYISTKVTYKTDEEDEKERMETAARMEFIELQDTSMSSERQKEDKLDEDF